MEITNIKLTIQLTKEDLDKSLLMNVFYSYLNYIDKEEARKINIEYAIKIDHSRVVNPEIMLTIDEFTCHLNTTFIIDSLYEKHFTFKDCKVLDCAKGITIVDGNGKIIRSKDFEPPINTPLFTIELSFSTVEDALEFIEAEKHRKENNNL